MTLLRRILCFGLILLATIVVSGESRAQLGSFLGLGTQGRNYEARFSADFLILGRSGDPDPLDIVYSAPSRIPTTPLLNTADLELGASLSGRYDLVLIDNRCPYQLQLTLTGFPGGHSAEASRADPDVAALYFGGLTELDDASTDDALGVKYRSEFGSGEINLRRVLSDRVTLLSGFRIFALQEGYDFTVLHMTTPRGTAANTDNTLYGWQIGVESTIWTNGWARVDLGSRGGVFLNNIEVGTRYGSLGDPNIPVFQKLESNRTAFAGDVQVLLVVPIGGGSLRMGYQAYLVNNVGLVSDQFDDINFITNTGSVDLTNVVYQGGFVGFEIPF